MSIAVNGWIFFCPKRHPDSLLAASSVITPISRESGFHNGKQKFSIPILECNMKNSCPEARQIVQVGI